MADIIIKRLKFETNCASNASLVKFNEQYKDDVIRLINKYLEENFSRLDVSDSVIQKLEFQIDFSKDNVPQVIEKQLKQQLSKAIAESESKMFRKEKSSTDEALLFYLQKGYLPWNAHAGADSINKLVWEAAKKNTLKKIVKSVADNYHSIKRLIESAPMEIIDEILALVSTKKAKNIRSWIKEFISFWEIESQKDEINLWRRILWVLYLEKDGNRVASNKAQFITFLLTTYAEVTQININNLLNEAISKGKSAKKYKTQVDQYSKLAQTKGVLKSEQLLTISEVVYSELFDTEQASEFKIDHSERLKVSLLSLLIDDEFLQVETDLRNLFNSIRVVYKSSYDKALLESLFLYLDTRKEEEVISFDEIVSLFIHQLSQKIFISKDVLLKEFDGNRGNYKTLKAIEVDFLSETVLGQSKGSIRTMKGEGPIEFDLFGGRIISVKNTVFSSQGFRSRSYIIDILEKLEFHESEGIGKKVYDQFSDEELLNALWEEYLEPKSGKQFLKFAQKVSHDAYLFELLQHIPNAFKNNLLSSFFNVPTDVGAFGLDIHTLFYDVSRVVFAEIDSESELSFEGIYKSVKKKDREVKLKIGDVRATRLIDLLNIASTKSEIEILEFLQSSDFTTEMKSEEETATELSSEDLRVVEELLETEAEEKEYSPFDKLIYFLKFGYFPSADDFDFELWQYEIMEQSKTPSFKGVAALVILQNKGARLRFFAMENEDFQEFVFQGVFDDKYKIYISKSILLIKELKKAIDATDFSIAKTLIFELIYSTTIRNQELNWVEYLALFESVFSDRDDFEQDATKREISKLIEANRIAEIPYNQNLYHKNQILEFAIQFLSEKLPSQLNKPIVTELYNTFQLVDYSESLIDEVIHWILIRMKRYSDLEMSAVKMEIEEFAQHIFNEVLVGKIKDSSALKKEEITSSETDNWQYLQQLLLVRPSAQNFFEKPVLEFLIRNFDMDQPLLKKMVDIVRKEYTLTVIPELVYSDQEMPMRHLNEVEEITIQNWLQFFYELNDIVQSVEKEQFVSLRIDGFVQEIGVNLRFSDFNKSVNHIFKSFLTYLVSYSSISKVVDIVKRGDYKIVRLLIDQHASDAEILKPIKVSLQQITAAVRKDFEQGKFSSIVKSVKLKKQILRVLDKKEPVFQLAYLQKLIAVERDKNQLDEIIKQLGQYDYLHYQKVKTEVENSLVKGLRQVQKEGISAELTIFFAIVVSIVDPVKKERKLLIENIQKVQPNDAEQVFETFLNEIKPRKNIEVDKIDFWRQQHKLFVEILTKNIEFVGSLAARDVFTAIEFHTAVFAIVDRLSKPELKKVGLKLRGSGLDELGKTLLRIAEGGFTSTHFETVESITPFKDKWRYSFLVQTTMKELLGVLDKAHHVQIEKEFSKFKVVKEINGKQETILADFYQSVLELVKLLGDNYKVKLSAHGSYAPILNTLVTQYSLKTEEQTYSQVTSGVADFFFTNYSLQGKEDVEVIYDDDLRKHAFDFATYFLVQLKTEIELLSRFSSAVSEVNVIVEKTLYSLKRESGLTLQNVRSYLARNFKLFVVGIEEKLSSSVKKFFETTGKKLPFAEFFLQNLIDDSKQLSEPEFYAQFSNLILKSKGELKESKQILPQLTNYQQALLDEIRVLSESRRGVEELRFINALQSSVLSSDSSTYVSLIMELEKSISQDVKHFIYDERNLIATHLMTISDSGLTSTEAVQFADVLTMQKFISSLTRLSEKEAGNVSQYHNSKAIEGYVVSMVDYVASKRSMSNEVVLEELYGFSRLDKNERVAKFALQLMEDNQKESFAVSKKWVLEKQKEDIAELMKSSDIDQLKSDLIQRKHDWAAEIEEGEKLYIENAGLIIFAQFIEAFFKNLGYLNEERQFISYKEQERAVCILQYLATGKEEFPEHLLVLNKLLCGMDITNPILNRVIPNAKEKEEVNKLFSAVISNWPVVSNSSQDAIRETFVNREAIVFLKDRDWNIKVEHMAVDRLMSRIPWGFATLKLPWNKYIIFTEWI